MSQLHKANYVVWGSDIQFFLPPLCLPDRICKKGQDLGVWKWEISRSLEGFGFHDRRTTLPSSFVGGNMWPSHHKLQHLRGKKARSLLLKGFCSNKKHAIPLGPQQNLVLKSHFAAHQERMSYSYLICNNQTDAQTKVQTKLCDSFRQTTKLSCFHHGLFKLQSTEHETLNHAVVQTGTKPELLHEEIICINYNRHSSTRVLFGPKLKSSQCGDMTPRPISLKKLNGFKWSMHLWDSRETLMRPQGHPVRRSHGLIRPALSRVLPVSNNLQHSPTCPHVLAPSRSKTIEKMEKDWSATMQVDWRKDPTRKLPTVYWMCWSAMLGVWTFPGLIRK